MTRLTIVAGLLAAVLFVPPVAQAAAWKVDTAKSSLGFVGTQSGASFDGQFRRWQAQIDFDPANPAAGRAVVTIDMASAATGDGRRTNPCRKRIGSTSKDSRKPSSKPPVSAPKGAVLRGGGNAHHSRHDQERGVAVHLRSRRRQGSCQGQARYRAHRFGVGQGSWSNGQTVGLNVTVTLDLLATRQP